MIVKAEHIIVFSLNCMQYQIKNLGLSDSLIKLAIQPIAIKHSRQICHINMVGFEGVSFDAVGFDNGTRFNHQQ